MSTKLDDRLRVVIERVRRVWWLVMMAATVLTMMYMPVWCLLLLIPFAFISYFAIIYATISFLAATIPPEEIAEAAAENRKNEADAKKLEAVEQLAKRQAAGEKVSDDEIIETLNSVGIVDIVKVDDIGPVVGTYRDKNIYEYIHINIAGEKEPTKLLYHGPAYMVNGIAEVPVIDGMIFACVDNILYSKEK